MLSGNNGILTQASHAKFATEVSDIKEQVELKQLTDDSYYSGSINEFLGTTSNYNNKLVMQEGELVYISNNVSSREREWFEQLDIHKSSDYFIVEFDTAGGTEIDSQSIKAGKNVKKPNNPAKAGYEFIGWYYLKEGGTEENTTYEEIEFDFNTSILNNYSLYAKYSGEAIMTAYKENQFFWKYKSDITSIKFTSDASLIPSDIKESWNVKADINCSDVMAYLENNTNKLIIYAPYTIYANYNSISYFANFINLKSIDFSNFNTSKVRSMNSMFYSCNTLEELDVSNFNTSNITSMYGMFQYCNLVKELDVSNFDTSNVTNMGCIFSNCETLTSLDVSGWNTSNATRMEALFQKCKELRELDVSNFDTRKVTNMYFMFHTCSSLTTIDVSNFKTENVTNMYAMFYNCNSLTNLDVSNFDTSKVKNMSHMFYNCSSLTALDVSGFETNNVENMQYMFDNCCLIEELDISGFNTEKVNNMQFMFANCNSVKSLNVKGFDTSNVTDMNHMFSFCKEITELNLSSFNTNKVNNFHEFLANCSKLKTIICNDNWNQSNVQNSTNMFANDWKLVGAIPYGSGKVDISYANPITGYFTSE